MDLPNNVQYYAPDFELNVRSSNMENSNSREYLEKITAAVIDNLRQTGPAPSVQMQDVPRKPFGGMTDEEEAELDDLDEDENKDERMTEHRWDKRIENDAELEPSDDEDMSKANGATRREGNKRTFTDFKKGEAEVESRPVSPSAGDQTEAAKDAASDVQGHDPNDDTIDDPAVVEEEQAPTAADENAEKDADQTKVDGDGDVGMEDTANAEETTKIKQEEGDGDSAPVEPSAEKSTADAEAATASEPPAQNPKAATEPSEETTTTEAETSKPEAESEAMDVDEEKKDSASKDDEKSG